MKVSLTEKLSDVPGGGLSVAVWLGAIAVAAFILVGRTTQVGYTGLARTAEYEVSPVAAGRLDRLVVQLYERVEAGEVVASLDGSEVRARLATAEAELANLQAQLEAARTTLVRGVGPQQRGWRADLRRFEIDLEQRRLEALALEVAMENDRVEKQRLGFARERVAELHRDGVVSDAEYDDARLLHVQVVRRLDKNRALLSKTRDEVYAAAERKREFERSLPTEGREDAFLEPWRTALGVQAMRVEEIRGERQRLLLTSPVGGQVSQILGSRGQAVLAGEPVVMIAQRYASEAVAYMPEEDTRRVEPDMPVLISRRGAGGRVAESFVLRVAPTVEMLPARLWRTPDIPAYGRPFVVAVTQPLELVPGEAVNVRLLTAN